MKQDAPFNEGRGSDAQLGAFAAYFPSQFTIKLSHDMGDFLDSNGRARPGPDVRSAMFVHEYTHYLHNI